jgi:hypothetical protein
MAEDLALFFDIRRRSDQLAGLDVYPFVPDILARLRMVGGGPGFHCIGLDFQHWQRESLDP